MTTSTRLEHPTLGERKTHGKASDSSGTASEVSVELAVGDAMVEVATNAEQRDLMIGPFAVPAMPAPAP